MISGISFKGREEMLTAGIKEGISRHKFFKGDAPSEMVKEAAKEVKQLKNAAVESYRAAHQPILDKPIISNPLAQDSAVSGANIQFFG